MTRQRQFQIFFGYTDTVIGYAYLFNTTLLQRHLNVGTVRIQTVFQ